MKVVHIINSLDVGGAEKFLAKLITQRVNHGHKDLIITLKKGGALKAELSSKNINIIDFNLTWYNLIFKVFSIYKTLINEKPDIIQTWLYHSDILGSILGGFLNIPVVWNIRQTKFVKPLSNFKTFMLMKLNATLSYHFVTKIISVAQAAQDYHVQNGYCVEKFTLIPNGFLEYSKKKQVESENSPYIIGMVGRYHSDKDYHTMFKALTIVAQSFNNFKILLIGRGLNYSNKQLVIMLEELNLSPFVELIGEIKDPTIYYFKMDIFCLTSINEGLPNALGEAMSCGVFPISSNVGDASKLIGNCGLLFECGNYQQLANILLKVLSTPKIQLFNKGQEAAIFIKENFSISNSFEKYDYLYNNLINKCAE